MTRMCWRMVNGLVLAAWLLAGTAAPQTASAKGYSSGGGSHSYSSHSSSGGSHSYSSSSHSYSSGSSSRSSSSGSSKSFSSGSRSYSSGSSSSGNSQRGYSSGKSYGAGAASDKLFSSKPPSRDSSKSSSSSSSTRSKSSGSDSSFSFDTAAARAQKEQASKSDYTKYKESKTPPVIPSDNRSTASRPQTAPSSGGSSSSGGGGWTTGTWRDRDNWSYPRRTYVYVPDVMVIRTRPARIYNVFGGYTYRPWVTYNDPFSSLFWWWLLDRSLDDQAWWAYHHRYDMDPARYQALLANNQQLEARVAQLEAQQPVARDQAYTPTGLDRDLMYSDHYVAQAYNNRPTRGGSVAFWVFGVPLAGGFCVFLIWLIWFKRWQTAT